ncbi:hypothetical protein D9758_011138 [Tetrapyrgos nigripes]|uniref:NAD(P)-binding protein n=1 Tax=Tetrapyrgos nigripes TaxID=182062 RepID=A0A8H5CLK8_9AGAR|nr:hypothetical protein D9758_011138 [Tetrapyrgos nigripes]
MPIRLGFVGLSTQGWASSTLAAPLFRPPLSSKYHVVAVSTSNPESAARSAKKYSELGSSATGEEIKAKPYYGSTENISSDPDVDMVAVSIKTTMHMEAAMKVIEAGKDLFLEWPAGRNAKETEELYEAAKRKGIRTIVGAQFRTSIFARKVKSLVETGTIGRVLSSTLIISFGHDAPFWGKYTLPSHAYLLDEANGAGMLDIGAGHALEMFQFVLGPIISLTATTHNPFPRSIVLNPAQDFQPTSQTHPQTVATQAAVSGFLANNTVFNFHMQAGVAKTAIGFLWLIDGEEGSIKVEDNKNRLFSPVDPDVFVNGKKLELEREVDKLGMVRRAWDAFAEGRVGEYATLEDAVRNRRVIDAIKESGRTRQTICLQINVKN